MSDSNNSPLKQVRKDIDQINLELALLMEKRFQLLDKIAKIKSENNIPLFDKKREQEMQDSLSVKIGPQHKKAVLQAMENFYKNSLEYLRSITSDK